MSKYTPLPDDCTAEEALEIIRRDDEAEAARLIAEYPEWGWAERADHGRLLLSPFRGLTDEDIAACGLPVG